MTPLLDPCPSIQPSSPEACSSLFSKHGSPRGGGSTWDCGLAGASSDEATHFSLSHLTSPGERNWAWEGSLPSSAHGILPGHQRGALVILCPFSEHYDNAHGNNAKGLASSAPGCEHSHSRCNQRVPEGASRVPVRTRDRSVGLISPGS